MNDATTELFGTVDSFEARLLAEWMLDVLPKERQADALQQG